MIIECAGAIGAEVVKCLTAPLGRQFCYVYDYETHIQELKQQARDLENAKTGLQRQVDEAVRKGDEAEDSVKDWLSDAACKGEKVALIIRDHETAEKSCFFGLCPSLRTRYRFGRKATKTTKELAKLMDRKNFDRISYAPPPPETSRRKALKYVACESRSSCLEEIIKALRDPNVHMAGVYGMCGIGKTTLLHQVAKEVEATKIFQLTVIATVKPNPDLKTIQAEIARQLDLDFPLEMSEEDKRSRISRKLEKSETVLVILDDFWGKFEYDAAGIPFGKNHKGCKLLVASRSADELTKMDTQKNVQIGLLKYPEDWDLFKKTAGNSIEEDPDIQSIAREVVEVCSGLPITIVTIAHALKNKPLCVWKDALAGLKRPNPTGSNIKPVLNVAYKSMEVSYYQLESEELKLFFLLCAMFANSSSMDYLMRYAMGLGLFEDIQKMEDAHNRVLALENKLKASCLLMEDDGIFYKMHDLARDVGRSIALKEREMLTVRDFDFEELPMKVTLECRTFINLERANRLPENLVLPHLELFALDVRCSLTAPDSYFEGMPKLKVLDLTGMKFPAQLPTSIQFLESLQTLCLDQCLLGDITIVGELRNLKIFSMFYSDVEQFPEELGKLTKLRLLDFRSCTKLKSIPSSTIARLARLETLYIGNSFGGCWQKEGPNATLAELKDLLHLSDLRIHVQDVKTLPQDFFSEHLQRYKIYVGDVWEWNDLSADKSSRILKIKDDADVRVVQQHGTKKLMEGTEFLSLDNLIGVTNICNGLVTEGFVRLKHLNIQNSDDVQHIIDGRKKVPPLEILELESLNNLKQICHGQLEGRAFEKLKETKVKSCHKLKNLFSFPRDKSLSRLQSIEVIDCEVLREIIEEEESTGNNGSNNSNTTIQFSELRSMSLVDLPKLLSFCLRVKEKGEFEDTFSEPESNISLPLFTEEVRLISQFKDFNIDGISTSRIWHSSNGFQSLSSLKIKRCGNLKYLLTSSMARHLVELRELKIHGCGILEEIVLRDDGEEDETKVVVFGKLEQLELHRLPNLKRFIVGRSLQFPFLWRLNIQFCDKLEALAQDDKDSGGRRAMEESQCYSLFNKKVSFPVLEFFVLKKCNNLKTIWNSQLAAQSFCNLREFSIFWCDGLQTLFAKERPNVVDAQSEELFSGRLKFEKLQGVDIQSCANLKSLFPAFAAKSFEELKTLYIFHCKELEEIVEKDKEGETNLISYFPNLNHLSLRELPELRYHCLRKPSSEWTSLEHLYIEHCHQVDVFGSEMQGHHVHFQISIAKAFPKLKSLSLDSRSINFLQHQEHPVSLFRNITGLNLMCFHEELDEFPLSFLSRFQSLSSLWVSYSSFKEIFSSKGLGEEEYEGALATLRVLLLEELQELKHICRDGSFSHSILQQLEYISFWNCNGLLTLASPTVSFQNLKTLKVWNCAGLKRLISFSTARSLVQLTTFVVSDCENIEEIVANEDNYNDEIVFEKLTFMEFTGLQKIQSFCNAVQAFKFPSLKEVIIVECPMIKCFSRGYSSSPKLKGVQLGRLEGDKIVWKGDLNSTVQSLYLDKQKGDREQDEEGDDTSETKKEE